MAYPTPRRLAVLLSGALLVVALGLAAAVSPRVPATNARTIDDAVGTALHPLRLARATLASRGGPVTTSTGETVEVRVSDALPVETATPESWAEFLTGLTHGPELADLSTYVGTLAEIQQICGSRALGCYAGDQLVALGETAASGVGPEEVVRHEYGHHIANHRLNAPWAAIDWGPKQWASAVGVCSLVSRRQAFPGDEGANYTLNPGEAWAEVYRLVDERRHGIATQAWPIVSRSFFPSEGALRAAELDVTQPWTEPRTKVTSHLFGKRTAKVWWIALTTPLDGDLRVSATLATGGTAEVALVAQNRRTVIRRAQWVSQRVKRLDASLCGQRSLFVRVTQAGALGRVRVSVTQP